MRCGIELPAGTGQASRADSEGGALDEFSSAWIKRIVFLGHVLVLGEVVESNLQLGVDPESMLIAQSAISNEHWLMTDDLSYTLPYFQRFISERPPAKHHTAITGSQIAHPNDDVGTKGMIGFPYR